MNQRLWQQQSYLPERGGQGRRVVITGLGAVCAAGVGVPALWQALLAERSGIGPITLFDPTGLPSRIAGEVRNFDPAKLIDARLKPKRLARQAQFAVVAAAEAVDDAGFARKELQAQRCGVVLGSALSNPQEIAANVRQMEARGAASVRPSMLPAINIQGQATAVAELFELQNSPAFCVSTSCMSGISAVTTARSMILAGQSDVMICGGTDAPLDHSPATEMIAAGMCSFRNDEPERASRPFDRERDNGLLAEGAGVVILERLDMALDRGATIYAEILGDHSCSDQDGTPPGSGWPQTIRTALQNALCDPSLVDYVSAWGCGDPLLDRMETQALKEVFGSRAHDLAVSSIKAVTGNPLGAAGPLQLAASAMSIRHGLLPPTANYEHGDIDCDLDYIQGAPRRARPRRVLLNTHGMGGGNTCVILGPAPRA